MHLRLWYRLCLPRCADRDIEFPDHFDIFHLKSEIEPSDKTALEAVMDVDEQRTRLEAEAEWLIENEMGDSDRLVDVYERLDEIDADRGVCVCVCVCVMCACDVCVCVCVM